MVSLIVLLLCSLMAVIILSQNPRIARKITRRIVQMFRTDYQTVTSVHVPDGFTIHGIDVSHYQGAIDWDKVNSLRIQGEPLAFVYLRASMGVYGRDTEFSFNRDAVRQTTMRCGAYHFYHLHADPIAQANHFLQTTSPHSSDDLPPVLDVEGNITRPDSLCQNMQLWLDVVEDETGKKPIIYTNYNLYRRYFRNRFPGYAFWIAHYDVSYTRALEDPAVFFWQHQDEGRIDGIDEDVDFNVFSGTDNQFLNL